MIVVCMSFSSSFLTPNVSITRSHNLTYDARVSIHYSQYSLITVTTTKILVIRVLWSGELFPHSRFPTSPGVIHLHEFNWDSSAPVPTRRYDAVSNNKAKLVPKTWNKDSLIFKYSLVVWITSSIPFKQVRMLPTSANLSRLFLSLSLHIYLPSNIVKNSTGDAKAEVRAGFWRYSIIGLNTLAIFVSRSFGLFTFIARATIHHIHHTSLQKATHMLLRVTASVALVASW